MKKETIFRHEINESMAASAAMSCLKNRNNTKQLNETSDFDNRFELRSDLKGMANDVTKQAYMLIRKEFGDNMWRQLGMDDCDERGLIDMLNYLQELYGITNPQDLADLELGRKSVRSFKKNTQEQEENIDDYTNIQTKLADAWDEEIEDDDFVPYHNTFDITHKSVVDTLNTTFWMWVEKLDGYSDVNFYDYTDEKVGKAIEQVLDATDDFPADSVNGCLQWFNTHGENVIKVLETGSLHSKYEDHPQFDFEEHEEIPTMEERDMYLLITYTLGDSFIANDGDLDDIYYAVVRWMNLMKFYAPQSKNQIVSWCEEYSDDIEEIMNTPTDAKNLKRFVNDAFECLLEMGGYEEFYDMPKEQVKQAIYKALCNTPEHLLPWARHYAINSWTKQFKSKIWKYLVN